MTPERIVRASVALGIAALGIWIIHKTYWGEVTVREPPRGEAASNAYYGLQRLGGSLGIRSEFVPTLSPLPPHQGVLVLPTGPGDLLGTPIEWLQRWVEAGGRIVVPATSLNKALRSWSGISSDRPKDASPPPVRPRAINPMTEDCDTVTVQAEGAAGVPLTLCENLLRFGLTPHRKTLWTAVSPEHGVQALRVGIGQGSMAVTPGFASFLGNQDILKGDNARILLAAMDVSRGDRLYILQASKAESLGALLWRIMAPAVVFAALAALLMILRYLPRFGPPIPEAPRARRSLAEQIRANAAFAWRTRRLATLRKAVRRGLDEAASRRIPAYRVMSSRQRALAIAGATGAEPEALFSAMTRDAAAGVRTQRTAIAVLERTRRALRASTLESKGNV